MAQPNAQQLEECAATVAAADDAIFDELQALERQRAQGGWPCEDVAVRMFQTQAGDFIRVLDRHEAPLSPGMVRFNRTLCMHAPVSVHRANTLRGEAHSHDEQCPSTSVPFECSEDANLDAFIANADEDFGHSAHQTEATRAESVPAMTTNAQAKPVAADVEEPIRCDDASVKETASPTPVASDAAMDSELGASAIEPWMVSSAQSPEELIAKGELVSSLLGSEQPKDDDEIMEEPFPSNTSYATNTTEKSAPSEGILVKPLEGFESLCEQWPIGLEERRKICYLPSPDVAAYYQRNRITTPCVLYWMRNALRVTHGNYALETALLLAKQLGIPVVTVCLVPCSLIYPTCHAPNANDAYARWSFADVYQQFSQAGLPFIGLTGSTAPKKKKTNGINVGGGADDGGYPLFQLFDSFSPYVVVTDDACDFQASRDLHQLAQFLRATPSSSPWGLVAIDSNACLPFYSRLEMARKTLAAGERFLDEDEFSRAYAEYFQQYGEPYAFTPIESAVNALADPTWKPKRDGFLKLLRRLHMEEVNWRIVESLNKQCSPEMAPFSEMDALQKLDRLLAEFSDRPAIQAELQGDGVLSLLPYIRHGTLFSGHAINQITSTIANCPPPRTPRERKGLAMLKVMRSRAITHLGKERDYALYLALWTSIQHRHREEARFPQSTLSFSKCFPIEALTSFSQPSALEVYNLVLPSWINNNAKFGAEMMDPGTPIDPAIYDPYELETARTNDLYWNDIQKFLVEHRYLHPLLIVYWSYRILQWSISSHSAIAMIESLLYKCALGATTSPDTVFTVWSQLFRLGKLTNPPERELSPDFFQRIMDEEVASQPKLKLQP